MKKYCLTLDLKNDPMLIEAYKEHHRQVWPEIIQSIKSAGIAEMEIYLLGSRLFMIMWVQEGFSFEQKAKMDQDNSKVQEWEKLMWQYQQALPMAEKGEKWMLMERIFELNNSLES